MKRDQLAGYLFGLGALLAYGVNALVIREGTLRFGVVLPGLTLALLTGLLSLAPAAVISLKAVRPLPRRAIYWIVASGLASSVGIGSYVVALSQAPVSVVTPISSVYPLVTLILARLFLQRSERITGRMVVGVGCVVTGVILVALSRG